MSTRAGRAAEILAGTLIGLAMAFMVFDPEFFFGDTPSVLGMSGDSGSSFAGFRFFVNDDWHFPLLETHSMRDRAGAPTIIALTDSLPLLSLVAKAARPLGMTTETWIGLWYFGCFAGQGAAASFAVRCFGARSAATTMTAAVLAVSAPVLFLRAWHPGLLGQFTVLLSLAAAASILRTPSPRNAWWGTATIALALLVHPYFFAMSTVIVAGSVASCASRGELAWRHALRWAGGSIASMVTGMVALGYLPSEAVPAGGFGAFGTHLVGPFWPQWSGLWPGDDELLLSPAQSFEGVTYLGAGAAVIVLVVLVIDRRRLASLALDHQVLTTLLIVLVAVAVTPMVQVGPGLRVAVFGEEFARLKIPAFAAAIAVAGLVGGAAVLWLVFVRRSLEILKPATITIGVLGGGAILLTALDRTAVWDLFQQFRASGRFFWVIGYGATLWALVLIEQRLHESNARGPGSLQRPQIIVGVMAAVAVAQVLDTGRYRSFVADALGSDRERTAEVLALAATIGEHDRVRLATSWFCTATPDGLLAFQDVVIAASIADVEVDRFYGGRTSTETVCETSAPIGGPRDLVALPAVASGATPVPPPADLTCVERRSSLTLCSPLSP